MEVTMKSYYILSAIGKDRPGIVADVSEVIYECGGNIEDSNMGLLRTHFALLILFSAEKEEIDQKLSVRLKRLEWEKNLTVFYSPITFEEAHAESKEKTHRFHITTSGIDHSGIVCRVARFLADRGINILDLRTQRVLSAESGTPLFEMDVDIDVSQSISEHGLRDELHHLANELMIDLVLRKR
jgi:glycine cleavage system transcriptional repressor